MLTELRISHFALIDYLELEFSPGFQVFTGETGAGKSLLVDALILLLGGRRLRRAYSKRSKGSHVGSCVLLIRPPADSHEIERMGSAAGWDAGSPASPDSFPGRAEPECT